MPRTKDGGLSEKQKAFVEQYLIDMNATQAAIRAKYNPRTARQIGTENLAKPAIKAAIDAAIAKRNERLRMSQDDVVRMWETLSSTDPRALVEYRRTCCRHCYGQDFGYQRTKGEMAREYEAWKTAQPAKKGKGKLSLVGDDGAVLGFDQKGGVGYDKRKPPHPECPECFGEGVAAVFINDTRTLSPEAARLYAGAKETNTGIQVNMRDQDQALANLAKHMGMFTDRVVLEGTLAVNPAAVARVLMRKRAEARKAAKAPPK